MIKKSNFKTSIIGGLVYQYPLKNMKHFLEEEGEEVYLLLKSDEILEGTSGLIDKKGFWLKQPNRKERYIYWKQIKTWAIV